MIVGAELEAWLSSRDRQAASQRTAEVARRRWGERPAWARLRADISAADGDVEALTEAARRALERNDDISTIVCEAIAASSQDPLFRPPFNTLASELHSGLLLFDSPQIMISLGVIRLEPLAAKKAAARAATSIMFNGERTLLRLVKSGEAIFSFWQARPADHGFTVDTAGRCQLIERRQVADGETLIIDGSSQSFVIEHAKSDLILLQAVVHDRAAPLSVEYDSRTCAFVGASSADETGSRLEMMTTLLRLLDVREAIPLVSEAIANSNFHTRWHLMRELLAWDAEAALPALKVMAEADPHLDVRDAARRTLQMFFAEEDTSACRE